MGPCGIHKHSGGTHSLWFLGALHCEASGSTSRLDVAFTARDTDAHGQACSRSTMSPAANECLTKVDRSAGGVLGTLGLALGHRGCGSQVNVVAFGLWVTTWTAVALLDSVTHQCTCTVKGDKLGDMALQPSQARGQGCMSSQKQRWLQMLVFDDQ